jgi:hypothetical protein
MGVLGIPYLRNWIPQRGAMLSLLAAISAMRAEGALMQAVRI